jgi:serine protease Do
VTQEPDALAVARALERAFVDAIARAEPAVVSIARVSDAPGAAGARALGPFLPREGPPGADPEGAEVIPDEFGSGVLIENPHDPRGRYVLTAYHVVFGDRRSREDPRSVEAQLRIRLASRHDVPAKTEDARPVRTKVVGADNRSDLAVLELDLRSAGLSPDDVPTLPLGHADQLRKGQFVLALGNPYAQARDGSAAASFGMISNLTRRPKPPAGQYGLLSEDAQIHHYGTLLQVDTRLNLGASGGALLNLDGELIGITTALAALEGYEKSVGYAIPLDAGVRRIIDDLLQGREPEYGFLGINPKQTTSEPGAAAVKQPTAVLALTVAEDAPAWDAGLRSGDLVLAINGQPVYDSFDLMRIIGLQGPGATVTLRVRKKEQVVDLVARLGKWPVYDDEAIVTSHRRYALWRGLAVDYPTARRRFLSSNPLARYRRAVAVTDVQPDTAAAAAGLQVGDFIARVSGAPVQTPGEFYRRVEEARGDVVVTLLGGQERVIPNR